jgi:hypothetical protein
LASNKTRNRYAIGRYLDRVTLSLKHKLLFDAFGKILRRYLALFSFYYLLIFLDGGQVLYVKEYYEILERKATRRLYRKTPVCEIKSHRLTAGETISSLTIDHALP